MQERKVTLIKKKKKDKQSTNTSGKNGRQASGTEQRLIQTKQS